jgi:hypothetical protein
MNKLEDALRSLARQLQERYSDDAETTITLTIERAQALFEAITAPQSQREWVWLTEGEVRALVNLPGAGRARTAIEMAYAVQAKLKEKNT